MRKQTTIVVIGALRVKVQHARFTICSCAENLLNELVNSVEPDKIPQNVASDLALHCLIRLHPSENSM